MRTNNVITLNLCDCHKSIQLVLSDGCLPARVGFVFQLPESGNTLAGHVRPYCILFCWLFVTCLLRPLVAGFLFLFFLAIKVNLYLCQKKVKVPIIVFTMVQLCSSQTMIFYL